MRQKEKKNKLPVWKPLAWSSRAVSLSLNVILMGYLTFYCTDMLGLPALAVGTVMLVSKLADGFTDLIVGFIIEKTHTKWGKARPYELFVIGLWIFTILLFNVPASLGTTGKYIYIFIMFFLANSLCYTFVSGNETIYLVRAFPRQEDQISLLSVNGSIVMIVAIIFNVFFPQVVKTVGATAGGWSQIALIMGIPLAIIGLFRFFFIHEVVTEKEEQDVQAGAAESSRSLSLVEMMKLMLKNKYTWLLVGMVLIINFVSNMAVVTTYYFKYIVGDIGLQSLPALANMLTPVIILLFPLLSRKFGTSGVLRGGLVMSITGLIIRALGQTNIVTLIIGSALFTLGTMPLSMMVAAYTAETMDYGEWKNGIRIEGPLNSIIAFSQKVGPAIASGVTGLIMGLAGYDGLAEVQSAGANNAIVILYNWIPVVLLIGAVVLAFMWQLGKLMPTIKEELAKKRGTV